MAAAPATGRADGNVTARTTHELYQRYGRQIYAYCFHHLRSREEAEDAVQTTFLNAFRGLQGGTVARSEQAWLYKIAQNVCVARHSSSARRLRLETPNNFEILQEIVPSPQREGAVELIGIEDALEAMPENQRRAILLREWQGLSYREIAEELGLTQASVEMLIFRARRALANALEQPEEKTAKGKLGRRGISIGSLIAAAKSLLTGGAALKAVALAVAAGSIVVANAAEHTIVHHKAMARRAPASGAPAAQRASPAVETGRSATVSPPGPATPHLALASHELGGRRETSPPARSWSATGRARTAPDPQEAPAPPAAAAPTPGAPSTPPTASTPAPPAPSAPEPAAQASSPEPKAAPPADGGKEAAAPAPQPSTGSSDNGKTKSKGSDDSRQSAAASTPVVVAAPAVVAPQTVTTTTPLSPSAPPAGQDNGNGKDHGKGNENGHGHDAPAQAPLVVAPQPVAPAPPPVTTTPTTTTTSTTTTTTSQAPAPPPPPPAPAPVQQAPPPAGDSGHGKGNGTEQGKSKGKDH